MNIQNIKNETLHKLTAQEIGELGLCNEGVGLYKGELKTRFNGMKRTSEDGITFTFEGTVAKIEFTEIDSGDSEERHWAARIYRKPTRPNEVGRYETNPMGIIGCDYIR